MAAPLGRRHFAAYLAFSLQKVWVVFVTIPIETVLISRGNNKLNRGYDQDVEISQWPVLATSEDAGSRAILGLLTAADPISASLDGLAAVSEH